MKLRCKHCNLEMERHEDEPDVGIPGGWYCAHCDIFVHESEIDYSDELYD